jgi:hypothetical protein
MKAVTHTAFKRRVETVFVEDLTLFEQFFNSIKEGRKIFGLIFR